MCIYAWMPTELELVSFCINVVLVSILDLLSLLFGWFLFRMINTMHLFKVIYLFEGLFHENSPISWHLFTFSHWLSPLRSSLDLMRSCSLIHFIAFFLWVLVFFFFVFFLLLFKFNVQKETLDLSIPKAYRNELHLRTVSDGFDLSIEKKLKQLLDFLNFAEAFFFW